jgi:hypothetical protein
MLSCGGGGEEVSFTSGLSETNVFVLLILLTLVDWFVMQALATV